MAHQKAVKITLGAFPVDHRIEIEGKEISHLVKRVKIEADAHGFPVVLLEFIGYYVHTELNAKVELEISRLNIPLSEALDAKVEP